MKKDDKLISAVKLVNEAIMAEYKRLEEVSKTEESDPIMVEGETTAGYFCQLTVDLWKTVEYSLWFKSRPEAP